MAIPFTKYVDISSVVGGSPAADTRELIGRLFTTNPLLPPASFVEFTTISSIGAYFGTASQEYLRGVAYFSFINKSFQSPEKISFARWVDVDVAPRIYGVIGTYSVGSFTSISDGAFYLTLGGVTNIISGLDFTSALSLSDVASIIQAGINAETGIQWTGATVSYNAVRKSFDFVGGDAVAADISTGLAGSGTEILNLIGWGPLAIFSEGALAMSITDTLTESADASDNFASYLFMPTLTLAQHQEAAAWNAAFTGAQYEYFVPVLLADYITWSDGLSGYRGCGLTISEIANQYPEQLPMQIIAATNYSLQNSVQGFMYQQSPLLTPSVSSGNVSNALDAKRVNYYGITQTAGDKIAFYQRGVLMGGINDPDAMNTYANEIWFRDACGVALINMLIGSNRVPASDQGIAQALTVLQGVIDQALFNGTISLGQVLTTQQIATIGQISGDPDAWYQVQNIGYWRNATITQSGPDYVLNYTVIYTKDDQIRKITGLDLLI